MAWARKVALLVFVVLIVVVVSLDLLTHDRPYEDQLERSLFVIGLLALGAAAAALRSARFARFGARDHLLRQMRAAVERNPAMDPRARRFDPALGERGRAQPRRAASRSAGADSESALTVCGDRNVCPKGRVGRLRY
jgi:hypothetical protein